LRSLVEECLTAFEARTHAKGLSLIHALQTGVPKQLLGDPGRIRQVLYNLVDNAIKFTKQGGIQIQMQLYGNASAGYEARFSVTDTGVGIAADKQKAIFDAFNQTDASTTRQFGGTGLGLTICRSLVELMGGRIWVESELQHGSAFHFTVCLGHVNLPAPVSATDESTAPILTVPSLDAVASRQLTILLVEDHPTNQLLTMSLLKRWKHQVVLAQNGQEALALFGSHAWDIVLMDIQMPVMDGLEATKRIRALEFPYQRVPIVAVTANAMEWDHEAYRRAGMDDLLAKPFSAACLATMLELHCIR